MWPLLRMNTPGTMEMGRKVAEQAVDHNTILMANHGVVAWSHLNAEDAYWKMEIIGSLLPHGGGRFSVGNRAKRLSPRTS